MIFENLEKLNFEDFQSFCDYPFSKQTGHMAKMPKDHFKRALDKNFFRKVHSKVAEMVDLIVKPNKPAKTIQRKSKLLGS